MATDHQIELRDDGILLRAIQLSDAEPIFAAIQASRPEISRWMPWCHPEYDLSDVLDFIHKRPHEFNEHGEHNFVIVQRETSRLLGMCGINHVDKVSLLANLGYWIRTDAAGRGIATRAARLVAGFALLTLGYQRLEIVAAIGNLASQRVAEKLGATRECIARNRARLQDQQQDAVVYSLVPADLSQLKS